MIERLATPKLRRLLQEFPAVAILGPRQVGKTTLALELAKSLPSVTYVDFESPSDRAKLSDMASFFDAHHDGLLIFDEVQREPGLFPYLRGVIDQRRREKKRHGQFLLLGSASGELLKQSAESLAGRIAYFELTGFDAGELPARDAKKLWVRGGFPDSFLADSDEGSLRWRQQFITTYLERDIPILGPKIPAETLRRLWTMLAHEQGTLLNAAKLAASLAVSGQTVVRYLDLLVDLMLVRRLPSWVGNVGKRLVRSPKIYVRDSGVVHGLLGLATFDDVTSHPVAGGSWEGWVIENLLAVAPEGTQAFFFRTAAGAELDLLLELPKGERWAIEIKRSSAPTISKGFHLASTDLNPTEKFVVYSGHDNFSLSPAIRVVPLCQLQQMLRSLSV